MEKRGEPRFDVEQTVRLTTLGEESEQLTAQVVNISGTGMRLLVDRLMAPGLTIKVEWDEILLLGEVCYCQPDPEGYAIGLELEHALLHTRELARLAQQLLVGEADSSRHSLPQAAPVRRLPKR
jgi:hypothetical protein